MKGDVRANAGPGGERVEPEYTLRGYDDMLSNCHNHFYRAARLVPQLYNRLTLVHGYKHKDAMGKILNDLRDIPGFRRRTVTRHLPEDNPNVPRRVRPSWRKNSLAMSEKNNELSHIEPAKSEETEHKWFYSVTEGWHVVVGDPPIVKSMKITIDLYEREEQDPDSIKYHLEHPPDPEFCPSCVQEFIRKLPSLVKNAPFYAPLWIKKR